MENLCEIYKMDGLQVLYSMHAIRQETSRTNQRKKKTHTSLHFAGHNTLARNIIHLRLNRTNTQKAAKNLLKW